MTARARPQPPGVTVPQKFTRTPKKMHPASVAARELLERLAQAGTPCKNIPEAFQCGLITELEWDAALRAAKERR